RHVSWIKRQSRAHSIGHICVSGPGFRIGEGKRPTRPRMSERGGVTEGRTGPRLAVAERELDLALHDLVVKSKCRWDCGGLQRFQCFRTQFQFSTIGSENAIGPRHCPRGADTAGRWDFEVARTNMFLIAPYCDAGISEERSERV